MKNNKFGMCERCGKSLSAEWFKEEECINGIKTGRVRKSISFLFCENCFNNYCVDDSFDEVWERG